MNEIYPLETMFFDTQDVWAIRISKVDKLDLQKTFKGFQKYTGWSRLLFSEEVTTSGVLHHHGLVAFEPESLPEAPKKYLNQMIKSIYPDAKGNRSIYLRVAQNKNQLTKYTVKDGLILYEGFSPEYIAAATELSQTKDSMKGDFSNIKDLYLLKKIRFKEYMTKYIELKVEHNQPLYNNHLTAYFRSVAILGGDLPAGQVVDKIYEDLFNLN